MKRDMRKIHTELTLLRMRHLLPCACANKIYLITHAYFHCLSLKRAGESKISEQLATLPLGKKLHTHSRLTMTRKRHRN